MSLETAGAYWRRKVLMPIIFIIVAIVIFSLIAVYISGRSYAFRSLQANATTLSMMLVDPILLGDDVELMKRVFNVGSKNNYNIVVFDSNGEEIERYKKESKMHIFDWLPELTLTINENIIATDGRRLGQIFIQNSSLFFDFNYVVILFIILIGIGFFLLHLRLLQGVRPIVSDLIGLGQIISSSSLGNLGGERLHFSESQNVYNKFVEQSQKLVETAKSEKELSHQAAIGEMAAQVAHDIRSPLTALSMIERDLSQLPEDTRVLLRKSISRIRDIANDLVLKNKSKLQTNMTANAQQQAMPTLISSLIESIVTEKRISFRQKANIEIVSELNANSYGMFADIQPAEFSRIISNLINNAVEAINEKGYVKVALSKQGKFLCVQIVDNGIGISEEKLSKLGIRGQTFGKEGGSGLGLHHAFTKIQSWNGQCDIRSKEGLGTAVNIYLPISVAPEWHVEQINLHNIETVVVLDDDPTIHDVWTKRLSKFSQIKILHFSSPIELRNFVSENHESWEKTLFLCDYEFENCQETGHGLISELCLANHAILVTSRFDELVANKFYADKGLRILPKGLATIVPIKQ